MMKLQTLEGVGKTMGGRPKMKLHKKKVRLSFYLDIGEVQQLKNHAEANDKTMSQVVRDALKVMILKE